MSVLIFVTATKKSESEFEKCPLGQSLTRIAFDKSICLSVSTENRLGLSVVYNQFITEQYREHDAVFLHDDIWLDDIFVAARIRTGLENYNVIGMAGNKVLHPGAPSWASRDDAMELDYENLSGIVCHGDSPFGAPRIFGSIPARVQLLDGVLIAVRISSLLDAGVRFDERFDFHFYDLDFSRQANAAGLSVGTWPISITHVSNGRFGSDAWKRGLELYRGKWKNAGI